MFMKLVFLFIVLPLLELWLIFLLANATSWGFTFLVVLGTGFLGTMMARRQGFKIWRKIQSKLSHGEIPGDILLDGLLLLVGGVLLITPGIITDVLGFILLIPFTRSLVRDYLKARFKRSIKTGATHFSYYSAPRSAYPEEDVIDVEWEEQKTSDSDKTSLPE